MGAVRPARAWTRELQRQADCAAEFAEPGFRRLRRQSVLRIDPVAESSGSECARNRLRKGARFEMAERSLGRDLSLPRCASGHGGGARFKLSTLVHHSVDERTNRAPGNERQVFRRLLSAPHFRAIISIPSELF